MQLIRALLIAATVVVLLSGVSIFFGSSKKEKLSAIHFLIAALGASIWTIAICIFLHMPDASPEAAHLVVTCIIGGVTFCDIGLLAYLGWNYKGGKSSTLIFTIIGVALVSLLAYDSSLFYSSIDLSKEYTQLFINHNWYYFTLIAYFFLISAIFSGYLQKRIKSTTNKGLKTGLKIFYAGLSIGGILALIFNLILITSNPNLVWIGPMATIISIMTFYYSIVKFRTLSISTRWMEIMSYIILITTAIIIYLLIFYIAFSALFGSQTPSAKVLILNVVMAVFLLLLTPALTELTNFMRANFFTHKIELGYIVKKLEALNYHTLDTEDVSKFLADTLHYNYCVIDLPRKTHFSATKYPDASKIIPLTSTSDKVIGHLVLGKHLEGHSLSHLDEVKITTVAGILSTLLEK